MRFPVTLYILLSTATLHAQTVKIGSINIYGNRTISADTILKYATVVTGDTISKQSIINKRIEKSIQTIPGIQNCISTYICCYKNGGYNLFIGVAENDSNIMRYRRAPTLRIRLPSRYSNARKSYEEKLSDAVQAGESSEDWMNGYALIKYPPARRIQEKFVRWADEDIMIIEKVLISSSYDEERATAAQMIAYHSDKQRAMQALIHALSDESSEVRNKAAKALTAISYYSSEHPEKNINIPGGPFIRLINSILWNDRMKGLAVLEHLTKTRNAALMNELKSTSLPSIAEMAEWSSEPHAQPAYVILCRMAGIPEKEINNRIKNGNFSADARKLAAARR